MPFRKHFKGTAQEMGSLFQEMRNASDRVAAIACAAVLDDTLGTIISDRFIRLGKEWEDRIFTNQGAPLGTFHAKIIIGYAMGLIGPVARADLHLIRTIRNDFAHSGNPVRFDDPEISAKCNRISERRSLEDFNYPDWVISRFKDEPISPRNRFITASEWLALDLTVVRPRRLRPIYPKFLR
jgi:DNA-binding MltR family transcriptional regulator